MTYNSNAEYMLRKLEQFILALRHRTSLRYMHKMWDTTRPLYDYLVKSVARNGLVRVINGTDPVYIIPQLRQLGEAYEPEVWRHLMSEVQPGDYIVDVGAFIGLYTVALSKRVGPDGRVIAFEPSSRSFFILRQHIKLNKVNKNTRAYPFAVGIANEIVGFTDGYDSQASMQFSATNDVKAHVQCVTLDTVIGSDRLDILKIDVEGFEERVLAGAQAILARPCPPKLIYIEVHPYAWQEIGTTSSSLLALLTKYGYEIHTVSGVPVQNISHYGEIIARHNRRII